MEYLDSVYLSRSESTTRTYKNALQSFLLILESRQLPPEETPITQLKEDAIGWFAAALKDYAPATERLYLTAAAGFYEYLAAEFERVIDEHRNRLRSEFGVFLEYA